MRFFNNNSVGTWVASIRRRHQTRRGIKSYNQKQLKEEILKLKARLDDIENMLHFEFKIDMAHFLDMNKVLPKPKSTLKKGRKVVK